MTDEELAEINRDFEIMEGLFRNARSELPARMESTDRLRMRVVQFDEFLDSMMDAYRHVRIVRDDYATMVRMSIDIDRSRERRVNRENAIRANATRANATRANADAGLGEARTRRPRRALANAAMVVPVVVALPEVVALPKKDSVEFIPDVCGICLDRCMKVDSVATCCGHQFCKTCYGQYTATRHCALPCPMCRKPSPKLTVFRAIISCIRRQAVNGHAG